MYRSSVPRLRTSYVPSLRADIIEPLQQAGFTRDQINALGGPVLEHNDVAWIV